MNNLTEKFMELRIDITIKEFNYKKRKEEHPEECPCNGSGPCHNIEDLNCFFCYCPFYENSKLEGGCSIGNPLGRGKWFDRPGHERSNRVWDCSECIYPHEKENVRQILIDLFGGGLYYYLREASEDKK